MRGAGTESRPYGGYRAPPVRDSAWGGDTFAATASLRSSARFAALSACSAPPVQDAWGHVQGASRVNSADDALSETPLIAAKFFVPSPRPGLVALLGDVWREGVRVAIGLARASRQET